MVTMTIEIPDLERKESNLRLARVMEWADKIKKMHKAYWNAGSFKSAKTYNMKAWEAFRLRCAWPYLDCPVRTCGQEPRFGWILS